MRRSSCFNTLLRITTISVCVIALSAKNSHSGEIKFDQIKGEINWDDPKFLVEAQQNYQLAKEIQKDAKRRKQLKKKKKTEDGKNIELSVKSQMLIKIIAVISTILAVVAYITPIIAAILDLLKK